jgi:hypothetical protein
VYDCAGGVGTGNCQAGTNVKAGDLVRTSSGTFAILSKNSGFTIARPITPGNSRLSDRQVANIVFNETRSLSGEKIAQARLYVANAVMNGDRELGDKRPITASTDATVPSSERPAYEAAQGAVALARAQRSVGYDPTAGSVNFNLRPNASTGPFFGHQMTTQSGPLANSFPTKGLPSTGIYVNTYGDQEN